MANVRYISFLHEVTPDSVRALLRTINEIMSKGGVRSFYLLISTPGGSVDDGIMLYNALRALPIELTTHNIGNVDSIGNVIFLAGSKRLANFNATFMWHGVAQNFPNPSRFELKNVREMAASLEAHTKRMSVTVASRTSLIESEIHELFVEASTKDAVYAKEHGLIQEITDAKIPDGSSLLHSPAS